MVSREKLLEIRKTYPHIAPEEWPLRVLVYITGGVGVCGEFNCPGVQKIKKIAQTVKYRVRRLTPTECERLDGFPDGWTRYGASGKEMSDNARYMALGNSIAVPCAERVFIGICKADRERRGTGGEARAGT